MNSLLPMLIIDHTQLMDVYEFRRIVDVGSARLAAQNADSDDLEALEKNRADCSELPVLILWGKMAEKLISMPFASSYRCVVSEHPYNLSFIRNADMQALFKPMRLLYKKQ